jgi:hypothetical protein
MVEYLKSPQEYAEYYLKKAATLSWWRLNKDEKYLKYCTLAIRHYTDAGRPDEAADVYLRLSKRYPKKEKIYLREALNLSDSLIPETYERLALLEMESNNFMAGGRLYRRLTDRYVSDDKKISTLEKAIKCYRIHGAKANVIDCLKELVELFAQKDNLRDIVKIYTDIVEYIDDRSQTSLNIMQEYCFRATLGQLVIDTEHTENGAEKLFVKLCMLNHSFEDSLLGKFAIKIINSVKSGDAISLSYHAKRYDEAHRLDDWTIGCLAKISRTMKRNLASLFV